MDKAGRKTPLGIEKRFDSFGHWLDTSWALRFVRPILDRYPLVTVAITWLLRLVVGGVFVVSGVTKGVDPWGSYYKVYEYMLALNIPVGEWGNAVLILALLLFTTEFFIGASLVCGCFRKATPIVAALFMLFMLPLTLWIAVADPVADCGCFGDFLVISNWATFIKNVLLSIAVVWLLKFNRSAICLVSASLQWLAAVGMALYILIVGYVGYWQQPMLDFRSYPIGTILLGDSDAAEYTPVYSFVYEKNGVEQVFSEDDELPEEDSGWNFVRREELGFVRENEALSQTNEGGDFRIWSEDGSVDVTESLYSDGYQLLLLIPDIRTLSMATSWKINRLYDMAKASGAELFAVAAGSVKDIARWRDLSSGQYPIYTADDTSIKELARGNPAIVSLDGGKIIWKTALSALLIDEDVNSDRFETSIIGISMSGIQSFVAVTIILVNYLAILAILSFFLSSSVSPLFARRINSKHDKKQDCEAPKC